MAFLASPEASMMTGAVVVADCRHYDEIGIGADYVNSLFR